MDILAGVEPQLAIPVVVVVVLAILVYLFGFQQTQEPSLQHLAVLHSAGKSKSSGVSSKQKGQLHNLSNAQKGSLGKGKEKNVANGHAGQSKEKIEKSNKENIKPVVQTEQSTPRNRKEKKVELKQEEKEIEGGDWIPAVSRKDKKLRPKKDDVLDGRAVVKSPKPNAKKDTPKSVLKEIEAQQGTVEVKVISSSSATKEKKKKSAPTASVKQKPLDKIEAEPVVETKTVANDQNNGFSQEAETPNAPSVSNVSKLEGAKLKSQPNSDEPKSNIALEETADLWEEAKSRGAKKKRARKD